MTRALRLAAHLLLQAAVIWAGGAAGLMMEMPI